MHSTIKRATKRILERLSLDHLRVQDALAVFHSNEYLRHNARRLEHLASLGIPVSDGSVMEVGAGIGDHSHYYIDRGCTVTITEARATNLSYLRSRYPHHDVRYLDLESPGADCANGPFDVVHCYGVLYHLSKPREALEYLGRNTRRILLLETCVSFGDEEAIHLTREPQSDPSQACSGTGCRPTRAWLYKELERLFEHVYLPTTQPWHEEFPLDWTAPQAHRARLQRAIFVASRERLDSERLTRALIARQTRST